MNLNETINRCLQRDEAAEKALYYAYAKRIYGICRRYTNDDPTAKDLMQDSFEKLFQKLHQFDPNRGVFDAWVNRLVTNTVLSALRKKNPYVLQENITSNQIEETETEEDLWDLLEQEFISKQALLAAIRELPESYQMVLNLAVFEGWKHKQIANELGIAVSSSRTKLQRAKEMLRSLLKKHPKLSSRL